jgi:hypothetical protein
MTTTAAMPRKYRVNELFQSHEAQGSAVGKVSRYLQRYTVNSTGRTARTTETQ